MNDVRVLQESPPEKPGKSQMHIKGTGYLGHMKWVDELYPGGRPAYLRAISRDNDMLVFFEQPFFAHVWYDFGPLASAGITCARAMNMKFAEFIAYRARYQAQVDTGGVYKLVLKVSSVGLIARKLPQLIAQYFNFGQVAVKEVQANSARFTLANVPLVFAPWMDACITGYAEVVLPTAGAKEVAVEHFPVKEGGTVHGYPAGTIEMGVRWK